MKEHVREKGARVLLAALIVAYSVYFSALSIQRHNTFRTRAADLGQIDQALWNTLHGHFLEDTRDNGDRPVRQAPRLTDHVEPIFAAVALSYLIYDGVESILVLQSVVIALGALPIFWIARRRLKSDWGALAFAGIYLLFPALQAANLAEFHADTLAPAPLLFAYNYAEERAWKRFGFFSLLALTVKEQIPLLVAAMAVWAALRTAIDARRLTNDPSASLRASSGRRTTDRQPRIRYHSSRITFCVSRFTFTLPLIPLIIAAVSLVWFAVALFVIVPHFSPAGASVYVGRYTCLSQAIRNPLIAIPDLVGCVLVPDKIAYVLGLLASTGFIALLDPMPLLIGSPALAMNLLSSFPAQYSGTYYYSAYVAPYFVLAAIGGAGIASDWIARRWQWTHARASVILPVFAIALVYHAQAGYTPLGGEFFWPPTTPHQQLLTRLTSQIPAEVPVSTTGPLFPHLSHRRFLYRFPTIQDAEYILLDVSQVTTQPTDFRVNYDDALKQGFGIRDAVDGYILLERGLPNKELPDAFYDVFRSHAAPQYSVMIDFEGKLRFLGYDVRQDDWQRVYLRTYWTSLPGLDKNNYALFPFFVDDDGRPSETLALPALPIHFWYPTMRWKPGEVVIADSLPMELGARAKLGLGVFFGASWDQPERRLAPHTEAPVSGDWVLLGELIRRGKLYEVIR